MSSLAYLVYSVETKCKGSKADPHLPQVLYSGQLADPDSPHGTILLSVRTKRHIIFYKNYIF